MLKKVRLQSPPSVVGLVGSYRLVSSTRKVLDTGEVSDTFGKQPSGFIIYTPNGRMLVLIVSDNDRPAPDSGVAPTDEQAAKLFRTMQAYGGTYEFDGRTSSIISICREAPAEVALRLL